MNDDCEPSFEGNLDSVDMNIRMAAEDIEALLADESVGWVNQMRFERALNALRMAETECNRVRYDSKYR